MWAHQPFSHMTSVTFEWSSCLVLYAVKWLILWGAFGCQLVPTLCTQYAKWHFNSVPISSRVFVVLQSIICYILTLSSYQIYSSLNIYLDETGLDQKKKSKLTNDFKNASTGKIKTQFLIQMSMNEKLVKAIVIHPYSNGQEGVLCSI